MTPRIAKQVQLDWASILSSAVHCPVFAAGVPLSPAL